MYLFNTPIMGVESFPSASKRACPERSSPGLRAVFAQSSRSLGASHVSPQSSESDTTEQCMHSTTMHRVSVFIRTSDMSVTSSYIMHTFCHVLLCMLSYTYQKKDALHITLVEYIAHTSSVHTLLEYPYYTLQTYELVRYIHTYIILFIHTVLIHTSYCMHTTTTLARVVS